MQTTSTEMTPQKPLRVSRLAVAVVIASVVAAVDTLLIYFLAPALFGVALEVPLGGPGSALEPLPAVMVVIGSVIPAIGGGLLLGVLNRFSAQPIAIFRTVAVVVALLSIVPLFVQPIATDAAITLAFMHVAAAASITYVLTRYSQEVAA